MKNYHVLGSAILFGSVLLAGCGVNSHLAATPTSTSRISSGTIHTNRNASATPSPTSSSTPTSGLTSASQVETTLKNFLKGAIKSPALPPVPSVAAPGGVENRTKYYFGVSASRSNIPIGAVINFVGTTHPEPLNASAILPNHVSLGNIIGSYAASYGTPTTSVQSQWKNDTLGFNQVRDIPAPPRSMLSAWMYHASTHAITIFPNVKGTVYTAPSELPAVIWQQSGWQFEISNLYALKPNHAAVSEARTVIRTLNGLGTLTGHGVFYMVAAGDGQHTIILWSHGREHLALTDYHSASAALHWLATVPQSPLVHR